MSATSGRRQHRTRIIGRGGFHRADVRSTSRCAPARGAARRSSDPLKLKSIAARDVGRQKRRPRSLAARSDRRASAAQPGNRTPDRCPCARRDRSPARPDTQAPAASPPCRTPPPPHRLASVRSGGSGPGRSMKYRLVWPPETTSTAEGSGNSPCASVSDSMWPGEMMHRNDRDPARPGERLPKRDADEERADEARTLRHRDGADVVDGQRGLQRAPPRTTPQMSRTCCREASSGTTPPHSRWMAACDATTFERMRHGAAASPVSAMTAAAVSSQDVSIASRFIAALVGRSSPRAPSSSDSTYGAVKMPRSVMMPVMYRCGVTSNAGFRILAPTGVSRDEPRCVTSR